MSQGYFRQCVEGTFPAVPGGQRVRIDPGLSIEQGIYVAPDQIVVKTPFLVVWVDEDPLSPTHGCFDVQNLSSDPYDLSWTALYLFSSQYDHNTYQTGLGVRGVNPSPLPPVHIFGSDSSKWAEMGGWLRPLAGHEEKVSIGTDLSPSIDSWLRVDSGHIEIQGTNAGAWNGPHLVIGLFHLWFDINGNLRTKKGIPSDDTDGIIVGMQTP